MKALSIKQPWANLIVTGKKTIETRTRNTKYRGPLLIVSSKIPDFNALNARKPLQVGQLKLFTSDHITSNDLSAGLCGYALAIADLVDSRPMVPADQEAACCPIYPKAHSWVLENVRPLKVPFTVKGQLGIYEVSDELIERVNSCVRTV